MKGLDHEIERTFGAGVLESWLRAAGVVGIVAFIPVAIAGVDGWRLYAAWATSMIGILGAGAIRFVRMQRAKR